MPLYKRTDPDDIEDIDSEEEIVVTPELAPEEKSWAKRYGDLRRHSQMVIADYKRQLEAAKSATVDIPDEYDAAAIEEWVNANPRISKIVTEIARRQAEQATGTIAERMRVLDEREKQLAIEKAEQKLAEVHPDFFDEIAPSEEFETWLLSKSQRIQDVMAGEDYDWEAAADVVTLYKAEKGVGKPKPVKRESNADNPRGHRPNPPAGRGNYKFTESQIKAMSGAEYAANEEAIDDAFRTGKVLRDISGGAS